jgi:8-oxo-dGTP pyrophosphatase MutT (NUDIX family)
MSWRNGAALVKLIHGYRASRDGTLVVACAAVLFDPPQERILLTRRADNGRWCLPGGRMEAGESAFEACIREMREETSLEVAIVRLIGVYSNRDLLLEYSDGNRFQILGLVFEVQQVGGALALSDETIEVGYFTRGQISSMDVLEHHIQRIDDALAFQVVPFVRE